MEELTQRFTEVAQRFTEKIRIYYFPLAILRALVVV